MVKRNTTISVLIKALYFAMVLQRLYTINIDGLPRHPADDSEFAMNVSTYTKWLSGLRADAQGVRSVIR